MATSWFILSIERFLSNALRSTHTHRDRAIAEDSPLWNRDWPAAPVLHRDGGWKGVVRASTYHVNSCKIPVDRPHTLLLLPFPFRRTDARWCKATRETRRYSSFVQWTTEKTGTVEGKENDEEGNWGKTEIFRRIPERIRDVLSRENSDAPRTSASCTLWKLES